MVVRNPDTGEVAETKNTSVVQLLSLVSVQCAVPLGCHGSWHALHSTSRCTKTSTHEVAMALRERRMFAGDPYSPLLTCPLMSLTHFERRTSVAVQGTAVRVESPHHHTTTVRLMSNCTANGGQTCTVPARQATVVLRRQDVYLQGGHRLDQWLQSL